MQTYSLIAGIGNLGPEYGFTYHNAGILALEFLAQKGWVETEPPKWKLMRGKRFRYIRGKGQFPTLVMPTGFMNESGHGIKNALQYFKVPAGKMLVIHDDADLPLGEIKISSGQGSAGHRGVASIIDSLGTKEFARARIGIRNARYSGEKHIKAEEFVLKKMTEADRDLLNRTFITLKNILFEDRLTL